MFSAGTMIAFIDHDACLCLGLKHSLYSATAESPISVLRVSQVSQLLRRKVQGQKSRSVQRSQATPDVCFHLLQGPAPRINEDVTLGRLNNRGYECKSHWLHTCNHISITALYWQDAEILSLSLNYCRLYY